MSGRSHLVVAVDETGQFAEQKLAGGGRHRAQSGMVAVLIPHSVGHVSKVLDSIVDTLDLKPPPDLHARKILMGAERGALGLQLSQAEAVATVAAAREQMAPVVEAIVGVRGRLRTSGYFHEQQSWGEMLLALLHRVGEVEGDRLRAAGSVELCVASRRTRELCGYLDPEAYEDQLATFLRDRLPHLGWPKDTRVSFGNAEWDSRLIVADFHAAAIADKPSWCAALHTLHQPAAWNAGMDLLARTDRVGELIVRLARGESVGVSRLNSFGPQARHVALRRLVTVASGNVTDRDDQGNLALALRIVELVWQATASDSAQLRGELCNIAAQVLSHEGRAADDPAVASWQARAASLPNAAWHNNLAAARAAQLDHRCQTVQLDCFNIFDFESALFEFIGHVQAYELAVGGAECLDGGADELYGKLLGTVGQACGFLRAQDPATGEEAWAWLCRSEPHFSDSIPLFRAMSVGYRLTDLWDRGALDEAAALLVTAKVPPAAKADPYTLLHRLRIASARAECGLSHEAGAPLVDRLLALLGESEAWGRTPFDLCLKWALRLGSDQDALGAAATRWLEALDEGQVALRATSLPLRVQIGDPVGAAATVEALQRWPGFAAHWRTERARSLARCVEAAARPDFEALRAMPWNYA